MPLIINNIRSELGEENKSIIERGVKKSGLPVGQIVRSGIYKTSLDARHRNDIHFVNSVYIELAETSSEKIIVNKDIKYVEKKVFNPEISGRKPADRIVIAGFGPAGMFCGLVLAEYGYNPLILERGGDVESRIENVRDYWNGGSLDTESNVQFGEGGAGTFSDGKLTTRINDPLCRYVLERFAEFGAPEEILVKAKPHIGTDNLINIVKKIRKKIIDSGGEIKFNSRLDDIMIENNKVKKVTWNENIIGNSNEIKTSALILAVGHSARDTFEMLAEKNIFMESKPFSVGVRIEHSQKAVNESLYGKYADNPFMPEGEYQLSHRRKDGRCVYTFCMCPGGVVVPSASEKNTVVTNGMSRFARDGENANSAVAVSVSSADFGNNVLDGMYFARKIEQSAYNMNMDGGKTAPATTVGGFLDGKPNLNTRINPTYARGVAPADFTKIFPEAITGMLAEGLKVFSGKMKCFGDKTAVMTAPETRTSSPVRISRTENRNSISLKNLYPCGEGAGYAGGIISAAVDGIKTALAIMKEYTPE